MTFKLRSSATPYFMAVAGVLLATILTCLIPSLYKSHSMFLYLTTVTLVAWYGGFMPSLLTVVLSAIAFAYYVAPPEGFAMHDPQDKMKLLLFVLVATLISSMRSTVGRAQRAAASSSQRLAFALEAAGMGVWDLNLQTGLLWRSPSLEHIYGRSATMFAHTYEAFLGYVHIDDRDFFHRAVTRTMETGAEYHIQHRIVLPDGEVRWVATRGRIFFNEKGQPERLVAVTLEVNECDTRSISSPSPDVVPSAPSVAAQPEQGIAGLRNIAATT